MKELNGSIRLAASDLSNHLDCAHVTTLDYSHATGAIKAPDWVNPDTAVLQQLGIEHQQRYLKHLSDQGLSVSDLRHIQFQKDAQEETIKAMRLGIDVITEAVFTNDKWLGRADVLRRVEISSNLGSWSYQIYDCKLARETKAGTILQLSLYSDLLAIVQGITPKYMYVVSPLDLSNPEPFLVSDYSAYYRFVKKRLEQAIEAKPDGDSTTSEPNSHCGICRWWKKCDAEWRSVDHLSLVAGITRLQRKQLGDWDVNTMAALSKIAVPLEQRPEYGSREGYVKVREQAKIQVLARDNDRLEHEVFDNTGLARLPEPSPGDIFFDLEGDPFVGTHGLEYLFGFAQKNPDGGFSYERRWVFTASEEKTAFEWFVDFVMQSWAKNFDIHVYHFTSHESSVLKRLMGRYATREDEVDRMLRGGTLVDLHAIWKQSIRASVEQYSLKNLEAFYSFARSVPLEDAKQVRRIVEHSLELGRQAQIDDSVRKIIEGYNRDDCFSTVALRDWLENVRLQRISMGQEISRPAMKDSAPLAELDQRQQRIADLIERLRDPTKSAEEQSARNLLSSLLDWHRREERAEGQEYYRLKEMPEEELLYEKSALFGLEYIKRVSVDGGIAVDRYSFEQQDTSIRAENKVCERGEDIGEVIEINLLERFIDVKKTVTTADLHPKSIFAHDGVRKATACKDSLERLVVWTIANSVDSNDRRYRAARDLLLRRAPRLTGRQNGVLTRDGEDMPDAAKRIVLSLDSSVLAIQGPPGSGKTFNGAKIVCELIRQGKRVGVTAVPHRVIKNFFEEIITQAKKENLGDITCLHKVSKKSKTAPPTGIKEVTGNPQVLKALEQGKAQVVGGTSFLWAREELFEKLDVLIVDEAGQMSLADVVASAQSAKNLVLLGDPQQLGPPLQGSHPDGAEVSALTHLIGEARTIPPDKGLFLQHTRRLHPAICKFTSELFYDNILRPLPGLERQQIQGHPYLCGAGLYFVGVDHEGHQNASAEEADVVQALVTHLLQPSVKWFNIKNANDYMQFTKKDILVIAPYNAQVSDISQRLPGVDVGTVDKFQGREAAIVIYSLTTSSQEDAPRGMDFLYSLNRLNVATSRGRAACVVVGNPRILEPQCRTPRQMQLANALCRFAELANRIEVRDKRGEYEFLVLPAA